MTPLKDRRTQLLVCRVDRQLDARHLAITRLPLVLQVLEFATDLAEVEDKSDDHDQSRDRRNGDAQKHQVVNVMSFRARLATVFDREYVAAVEVGGRAAQVAVALADVEHRDDGGVEPAHVLRQTTRAVVRVVTEVDHLQELKTLEHARVHHRQAVVRDLKLGQRLQVVERHRRQVADVVRLDV